MPTPDLSTSSGDRARPPSRYVEYLNQFRRLKHAAGAPPADGAGLLYGTVCGGRPHAVKAKGAARPPDGRYTSEYHYHRGVRMVAGRSGFPEHDPLIVKRAVTAEDRAFRTATRTFNGAFASSMSGAGAIVSRQLEAKRAVRLPGTAAPNDALARTRRRTLADTAPLDGSLESWEEDRLSSVRSWAVPGRLDHNSIIRHRYSDPNSYAAPAKLESARTDSPVVAKPTAEASRTAFKTGVHGYTRNKALAMFGSQFKLV